jgi:hypothetical protein
MSKSPDRSPELAPLPAISAETARGRQRLFNAVAALGFTGMGAASLIGGEFGYLDNIPSVLLGGAFLATAVLASRNYRNLQGV